MATKITATAGQIRFANTQLSLYVIVLVSTLISLIRSDVNMLRFPNDSDDLRYVFLLLTTAAAKSPF